MERSGEVTTNRRSFIASIIAAITGTKRTQANADALVLNGLGLVTHTKDGIQVVTSGEFLTQLDGAVVGERVYCDQMGKATTKPVDEYAPVVGVCTRNSDQDGFVTVRIL